MNFRYTMAMDNGRREHGIIQADHERAARNRLEKKSGTLISLEKTHKTTLEKPFRIRAEGVTVFMRRLATMLDSGIQLADSMNFLGEGEPDKMLREAIEFISVEIESGKSLSVTMRDYRFKNVFDPVVIGMVQMGEESGELVSVITKVADQMERNQKFVRSLTSALTYPFFQFAAVIIMGMLFIFILGPDEGGLFGDIATETPWPTMVMGKISTYIKNPFIVFGVLAGIAIGFTSIKAYLERSLNARLRFHAFLLQVPGLGTLLQKVESSRILYVLADGQMVGLPLVRTMHLAKAVCRNEKMVADFNKSINVFSEGESLPMALAMYDIFPSMVLSMLEVGVESGKLDAVMLQVCKMYDEDVELALDGFSQLVGPALMAFAGFMAGFLALATLMPITNLVQSL